jgi:hypothetical protein
MHLGTLAYITLEYSCVKYWLSEQWICICCLCYVIPGGVVAVANISEKGATCMCGVGGGEGGGGSRPLWNTGY